MAAGHGHRGTCAREQWGYFPLVELQSILLLSFIVLSPVLLSVCICTKEMAVFSSAHSPE